MHFVLERVCVWCFEILILNKVEIILEPREVGFLSPSKICENLNFSREIQIFAKIDEIFVAFLENTNLKVDIILEQR